MKIKINPDQHRNFLKAVQRAESLIKSRTTLPILGTLLLTAKDGCVAIQSNNLDQAFLVQAEVEVVKEGQTCIAGRDLARIASTARSLEIEANDKEAVIRGGGTFRLPVCPVAEFPAVPVMTDAGVTTFTREELGKILKVVCAASDARDQRYILQGVCVNVEAKQGVACNGTFLMLSTPDLADNGWGPIIPEPSCSLISSLLKESEKFEVSFSAGATSVKLDGCTFFTRLIEGNYPNFKGTLPVSVFAVEVAREEFIAALDLVLVAQSDIERVVLTFSDEIKLEVLGKNANAEASLSFAKSPPKKAQDFQIAINSRLLRHAMAAMDRETISLEFVDSISPMAIKGDGYAVIMPMRTK